MDFVMSWLSLWAPRALFTCILLWPLVMATQPSELALDPVRLTSEPPGLNEPWSLHPFDLPPELPHVLTTLTDLGNFNILESSTAAPMVASPQELTGTSGAFSDATGELPPEPDQFALQLQDPQDKQEAWALPSKHPEEDKGSPLPLEALAEPLEPPEGVQATSTQQEAPDQPQEPFAAEPAPWEEAVLQPSEHPDEVKPTSNQQVAPAQPQEPFAAEPAPPWEEAVLQPSEHPDEVKPTSTQQVTPAQPQEPFAAEPAPAWVEALVQPSEHPHKIKPTSTQQEASGHPPEPPNEAEWAPTLQETAAQIPGEVEHSATLQGPPAQPPEYEEVVLYTPAQPPQSSTGGVVQISVNPEATFTPRGPGEAEHPISPAIMVRVMDVGLFITHQPTKTVKTASNQQAPPQPPEGTKSSPVLQEDTTLALEPLKEAELLLTKQVVHAQPSETPEDMEPSPILQEAPQHSPEPPTEIVVQPPVHNEVILPASGQDQAQYSHVPTVTIQPLDMGLTKTSEPTTELEHSTALTKTAAPPKYPQVTLPHPEQIQAQHPNLAEVTIQPLDLELTITAGSNVKAETSPSMQGTPIQPPKPAKEVVVQPPLYREVTVPTSGQDEPQRPVSPSITVHPSDLGLIVSAERTTEAKPSTALTNTIAPSPRHLEVTLPHPEQVQGQHPNPTEVTVQPIDLEVTITQQPESPETLLPSTTEQGASRNIDICNLCTCQDGTLSCTGLRPEQRLRTVPVLESQIYNGSFTIVNLRGNSISYIDENIWKSYRWVEKLILSENNLSELHTDSFEGLLSLQYLDLSCNKIESIERRTFEPLPFLQFINLGCNSITELSFGTFQAWHGMQFLDTVILDRNPLTTIEDSYLLKLPALRYLDMGRTQVSLTTVESILMMSLQLEKLILPRRDTCCLCQFKSDIEVVCKTVKLHCDTDCLIDSKHCGEELSSAEGSFMKVLQARKKHTSNELTIEPEKPSSEEDDIHLSAFMNNQQDFSDKSDAISALNYLLPYISEGNLKDVKSTLFPLMKLLISNIPDGDVPQSHLTNNAGNPYLKPESNDATYKNELRKLNFLKNLLDAEIGKIKAQEKTAMLIYSNILGPEFMRQFYQKELQTDQAQDNRGAEIQSIKKRLRVNKVLRGPKGIRKRHFKELAAQSIRRKQKAQPNVENTVKDRRLRRPLPREPDQLHMVQSPRKSGGNSFIQEHNGAVYSTLKRYLMGWPPASRAAKSLSQGKHSKAFSDNTLVLEDADARVRNMEAWKAISHSGKKHLFHKNPFHVMHKKAQAKMRREFAKKDSHKSRMLAKRPPFSAMRSLINSPARKKFSASELASHWNPLPESFSPLETSKETTTAPTTLEENISAGNPTMAEKTTPEIPAQEEVSMAGSAMTADNLMPTVNPSSSTDFTSPLFSSPGDQFENQLNQQLQSLIPNHDMRKFIAHVIRTWKMDCSEASVQLPCATLISRTGLLMKLLSEEQEAKAAKAEWDTDRWQNENYISESTETQSEQKGQEPRARAKEIPGYWYHRKLIWATSVALVVIILIIIFCVSEIHSAKGTSGERKKKSSRRFLWLLLRRHHSLHRENEENASWKIQHHWVRGDYTPLDATSQENMIHKTRNQDSSDEDETVKKDSGELVEVITD